MSRFRGKIAILKGGYSDEREISLKTGENVEKALEELGFNFVSIDCRDDFITQLSKSNFDLCFNALHGEFGEDGQIQALLEKIGIRYTHSGVSASILAMNKVFSKEIFLKNKIPTPDYKIKDTNKINPSDIPIPSVVKPINNGSSVGVYIILSESDKTNFLNELSADALVKTASGVVDAVVNGVNSAATSADAGDAAAGVGAGLDVVGAGLGAAAVVFGQAIDLVPEPVKDVGSQAASAAFTVLIGAVAAKILFDKAVSAVGSSIKIAILGACSGAIALKILNIL